MNAMRSSITQVSSQGIGTSLPMQLVTHVLGLFCYPCARIGHPNPPPQGGREHTECAALPSPNEMTELVLLPYGAACPFGDVRCHVHGLDDEPLQVRARQRL